MKRVLYVVLAGLVLLGVTCMLTKPSALKHRAVAEDQLRLYVQRNAQSNIARDLPIVSTVVASAVGLYSAPVVEVLARDFVVVEEGVFCNRAYMMVDGKPLEVSRGMLGQVYASEGFQRELNEALGVTSLFDLLGIEDRLGR